MRILAVDDSRLIRELVAECLKSMGHEIVFAENGIECLEYVKRYTVDLILMDIEMPGMNGLEATKQIREIFQEDWIPIIFLTTKTDDDSFIDGILAGADAFLSKPLNPLRLQHTVVAMKRIYAMRKKLENAQKKLQEANQELKKLSFFDQLTGIANRRNFDRTLLNQFNLANRNKSPLSLILCDVDYFKRYNDYYGHQQGDSCLAEVAQMLVDALNRPTDIACRYGGEEFAIILPDTDLQGGRFVAEKVRIACLEKQIPHSESKVEQYVTISSGVATYTGQFDSVEAIINAADEGLYSAKANGRNRVESA